ncbi:MAG: hypothetical protein J1E98_07925 [Lachnospiraceae bacterium]|nr:hypothetical protein [Lachnospiraceae bacterium]
MNRFKNKAPEINQEKKEIDSKKGSIEQYLNELLPELNLRLFLEMSDDEAIYVNGGEIANVIKWPQMMLWAESITVTSYTNAVNTHQAKRRIFNRLMGNRRYKKSFTLKKYKKERR